MPDIDPQTALLEPPVLPFRLRLVAAIARHAALWLRAGELIGKPAAAGGGAEAEALATLAAQCRAAAEAAKEAAAEPDGTGAAGVALSALSADISELLAHLKAPPALGVAPGLDPAAAREIDLAALADALPAFLLAAAQTGPLTIEPGESASGIAIAAAGAAPRLALDAPLLAPEDEEEDAPLAMFGGDAPPAPKRAAPPPPKAPPRPAGPAIKAADAAWMAVVERSPAARMILEDIARSLPLAARIADHVDQIGAEALASTSLRAVVFDPGERGLDWRAALDRVRAASRDAPLKAIAITRCSTAQAKAYERAGFDMVVDRPVSPQAMSRIAAACSA